MRFNRNWLAFNCLLVMTNPVAKRNYYAEEQEEEEEESRKPVLVTTRSVYKNGRYLNPWPNSSEPSLLNTLRWKLDMSDQSNVPAKEVLDETLPMCEPALEDESPDRGIRVTWIGHATVLVQFDGVNVLTDPIFSERCAPTQWMGPKRYRPVPCSVAELPRIDCVVISHSHYDHLDVDTVKALNKRYGPYLQWFVPNGLRNWMLSCGCETVEEMDWWQEAYVKPNQDVKIVFTPAQHWSARLPPLDTNKTLWGGWAIIGPSQRFFYSGDTAYCDAFEQIGRKYGPFDLAAIPIGCYHPWWFMQHHHVNPEMAVKIHVDVHARKSVAVHWGTFTLADEYYLDPPEKLKEALQIKGLALEKFFTLRHGETRLIKPHLL